MKTIETRDVPQANSLNKVCDLLALVSVGIEDAEDLMNELGLVRREIEYYKHAARILGFAKFGEGHFSITDAGDVFLRVKTPVEKGQLLAEAIQGAVVFADLFVHCGSRHPGKAQVVSFLLARTELNKTTAARRADTILAWLKTIEESEI
jgi:hypothetical protein